MVVPCARNNMRATYKTKNLKIDKDSLVTKIVQLPEGVNCVWHDVYKNINEIRVVGTAKQLRAVDELIGTYK